MRVYVLPLLQASQPQQLTAGHPPQLGQRVAESAERREKRVA